MQGAQRGTQSRVSRVTPWTKGRCLTRAIRAALNITSSAKVSSVSTTEQYSCLDIIKSTRALRQLCYFPFILMLHKEIYAPKNYTWLKKRKSPFPNYSLKTTSLHNRKSLRSFWRAMQTPFFNISSALTHP